MNNAAPSNVDLPGNLRAANDPLAASYTLYVVVTNRDDFLKECVGSFRMFYPSVKIVLIDNSGTGRFRPLGESLGLQVQATDRILSVTENQNWILDHCKTKYFVFSADDIVFLSGGFLAVAAAMHQKGFELVSLGVGDPCAFSMQTSVQPRIGRFNTGLSGKEKTDVDIQKRCEAVHGFLPSVGGFWRETPTSWESKYIKHYRFKPDVNRFLVDQGMSKQRVSNEKVTEKYMRLADMLYARMATFAGTHLYKYGNIALRQGLPPPVFEIRRNLRNIPWRNHRILSVGQVPRHYFWPVYLARFLGGGQAMEKVIIEKCEAFKPFLERKFTREKGYRIIADDLLNIDKFYPPKSVDLTVWYDGPEHLEKELALEAIRKIEHVTGGMVLMGTPRGFLPQGVDNSFKKISNPYNVHLSGWDVSEFEQLGYQTHVYKKSIPTIVAWKYIPAV